MTTVDQQGTDRVRDYRALVDYGQLAGIGVGHTLGLRLDDLEPGRSVWTYRPTVAAANDRYTVHGGVLATLMETAMTSAVHVSLPPRTTYTTAELSTKFLHAVHVGDAELCCEASVVHVGRRLATAEARVVAADGTVVAHGSCLCVVSPIPSGNAVV